MAVPTVLGQSMQVRDGESEVLQWRATDEKGKEWFSASFIASGLEIKSSTDKHIAQSLRNILLKAKAENSEFEPLGKSINMQLEFPRNWGLGSSSTLICNIAKWAEVDAFALSDASFGGSGVDIAVGMVGSELIYQRPPAWDSFVWNPPFKDKLWFIHLNRKQDSRESIGSFDSTKLGPQDLEQFSRWTEIISKCSDLDEFQFILSQHENRLSEILGITRIKDQYFSDYSQLIKSLGGWGGDFVLAVGEQAQMNYFKEKGFDTIIPFKQMVHH